MRQWLLFVAPLVTYCTAIDNGLATTPPVGWTTGNRFLCDADCHTYSRNCINEDLIKSTAQALAQNFTDSGVKYLYISAPCWASPLRSTAGNLQPNPQRFPSGMKALADFVHSLGLKVGLYLSYGNMTDDYNMKQDAYQMAAWGIDMVTMDANASTDSSILNKAFPAMSSFLNQTGRRILFSCIWPVYLRKRGYQPDYKLIRKTCNMYQTYDNAEDSWVALLDATKFYADYSHQVANYTGYGSWNYNYYTLVGNYGLSYNQQQYQLALWSVMASPLLVSADLRNMRSDQKSLLTNRLLTSIMAANEGRGGKQQLVLQSDSQVRVWLRDVKPTRSLLLALSYENISGGPAKVSFKLTDLNVDMAAAYNLTDVYTGKALGVVKPWYTFNTEVNPTGAQLIYAQALS